MMTDEELLHFSDALHVEADKVLEATNFLQLFGQLGKVTFVGSYALNLLYRRDIDVFVESENCKAESAIDLTKKLLEGKTFQTVGFADWSKVEAPNKLKGYYWQLIYYLAGQKWKFDVWFTAEEVRTIPATEEVHHKLLQNPEARLEILKLKAQNAEGEGYKDGLNGFKIYQKVLG